MDWETAPVKSALSGPNREPRSQNAKLVGVSEGETVVELPWAAGCCPCVVEAASPGWVRAVTPHLSKVLLDAARAQVEELPDGRLRVHVAHVRRVLQVQARCQISPIPVLIPKQLGSVFNKTCPQPVLDFNKPFELTVKPKHPLLGA